MDFYPVYGTSTPLTTSNCPQTTERLLIYGSSMPPGGAGGSQNAISVTITQVYNCLPSPSKANVIPLDYTMNDTQVDLRKISADLSKGKAVVYKDDDEEAILNYINQPKIVKKANERLKEMGGAESSKLYEPAEVDINALGPEYDIGNAMQNSKLNLINAFAPMSERRINSLNEQNSNFKGYANPSAMNIKVDLNRV